MERLQSGVTDLFPSHPPPRDCGVLGPVALHRAGVRAEPKVAMCALPAASGASGGDAQGIQMDQKTARPGTPSLRNRAPLALGERREKGPRAFPRRWAEEGSETCVEVVKFSALAQPGDNLANNQAFQRWGNRLGTGER